MATHQTSHADGSDSAPKREPQPLFSPDFLRIMAVWSVIPMYLIAGGLLGWAFDYLAHTFPFGIAVGLLAGLAFAVRDAARLRKEFVRPKESHDGDTD